MCLRLQRDNALHVFHLEVVRRRLVCRCELLHNRSLRERHVVLVCRENLVGVLLCRLLDHGEERTFHLLAVDDEHTAENLVAAVLRVDLCEAEHLRVGQRSAQLLLDFVQVFYFLWREGKTFLLVILLEVVDALDRLRLVIYGEHVLSDAVVHALQHRVVVSVGRAHGEILLNTRNAVEIHVLCYLNGIRTPRSNHFTAWSHEETLEAVCLFEHGVSEEPTKFVNLIAVELMVNLCCYHAL